MTAPDQRLVKMEAELQLRKDDLAYSLKKRKHKAIILASAFIFANFFSVILLYYLNKLIPTVTITPTVLKIVFIGIIPYSLFGVVLAYLQYSNAPEPSEILRVEDQLEDIRTIGDSPGIRAERRFRHHEYELKRYYNLTLSQSSKIFYIGIFNIFVGISIIIASFLVIFWFPNLTRNQTIIVGVLGSIGTILSNYIAVVYGRMYKDTIKSLTQFHNRLVATHHLHYGALLASQIKDDQKLINKTLSEMAINTSLYQTEAKADDETEENVDNKK